MLKIILIDDNPDDRILTIREIEKEFPEVEIEQIINRKGFEKALGEMNFNLVITDYQLKWSNGIEILKEIKKKDPFMPVIMFTATGDEEIAVTAMKNGLDDYVLKSPKHFKRLTASIKHAIEKVEHKKKVKETETRFRILLKNLPVGVYRTDYEGDITEFNPAFMEMFGYTEEELKTIKAQRLYVNPEDRKRFLERLEREDLIIGNETEYRRKDGTKFWGKDNTRGIKDNKGRIKYLEGIIIDVTREKLLQEELIQAQKMEAIGRLTGSIAHDFNNMLTPIMGFADLILSRFELDETQKLYIEEIKKSAQRASLLTKQLLAFSRKQFLVPEILDISKVIMDIGEMLKRLLGKDIELILEFEKDLWPCKADKTQIQQIIMNLAVNARDAMPGGGKLKIKVENVMIDREYVEINLDAKTGNYILITVEDTGSGIDKEIIGYVFEPFFTTKPPGQGTGLGLSVVYGIVRQHSGWINVYSEKGKGTSFKIYLPAFFESEKVQRVKEKEPVKVKGRGQKILVIEDEESVRKFILTILSKNNYNSLEAQDAKEALNIFEQEEIDAVICDIILPDKSGIEVVEEFIKKKPDLKIIMSSGYANREKELKKIKEKGWLFLQKPYTSSKLLETLSKIFEE